jgi:hypothetical protein
VLPRPRSSSYPELPFDAETALGGTGIADTPGLLVNHDPRVGRVETRAVGLPAVRALSEFSRLQYIPSQYWMRARSTTVLVA